MALIVRNTQNLVSPKDFKIKILVFGMYGLGKTTFMSTAPNLGAGVCETGHGKGLLTVAHKNFDYVELNSYNDFDAFCSGTVFKDKDTLGLDSLSEMVRTFIKDRALLIPRAKGESEKRALGVPELDDYGTMGELTRKLVRKLLDQPKHIVVTSGLRIDKPDPESKQAETLIGPDLSGQMFMGSTAMFDLCLCLRSRSVLRDPKDAKSRYTERYWLTENNGSGILAKNRLSVHDGKSFLPTEVIFDPDKNLGTFDYFYQAAVSEYTKYIAAHAPAAAPNTI
jgi:hypothetical protein